MTITELRGYPCCVVIGTWFMVTVYIIYIIGCKLYFAKHAIHNQINIFININTRGVEACISLHYIYILV